MTQIVVWLNSAANAAGRVCLAPLALLPGWAGATLAGAATGVLMLLAFKYTSNQQAIKHVRSNIKANVLALSLFRDNVTVSLKAQAKILWGAVRLLCLALVPMLVMLVPMTLLLGQLGLWFQYRPLAVGEEAVVAVQLAGEADNDWPDVGLNAPSAIDVALGPVRVQSQHVICWNIRPQRPGYATFAVRVGGEEASKEIAVGDGLMRVCAERPGWNWSRALLFPWERPFPPGSKVQSISIEYPARPGWASGADTWIIYWFLVSMFAALCLRRAFNVNL